jgi:UDP-glucose 6-dehydrogenase
MKNISIIGVGKLGLCLALNLERKGYDVLGIDKDKNYVNSLILKTFCSEEQYVNDYLKKSTKLNFSTSIADAIINDVIFVVEDGNQLIPSYEYIIVTLPGPELLPPTIHTEPLQAIS